jgi:regulator of protease activity HflC (stomatin/prohibitin superfamily)
MMMIEVKNKILRKQVTVPEGERALVHVNGKLDCILQPGRHQISTFGRDVKVESLSLAQRVLAPAVAETLVQSRPDLVSEHFIEVRTEAGQVAVVSRDGQHYAIQKPASRLLYWKAVGPWTVDVIDTSTSLIVADKLASSILASGGSPMVKRVTIEDGQVGLVTVDGALLQTIAAGSHSFWTVGPVVNVRIVDTREHALDVTGQEILTRDKVSLRLNLVAKYCVSDPVKAVTSVKDFSDALYRALQHAFRQSLSAKSLDDILSRKGEVDGEAATTVRADMAKIGLEVGDIAIKDVVLPGDMRDILNKVVSAEKEAEAQVIRRREETNATRSLLNTARVMAENPVMLRLKELEALEKIADKVQSLTVHNGTKGLLEDLVSLKGPETKAAVPAARVRK